MNASWMLVYFIIRWWSQGKIIRMSQGKICHKVNFFKRYISIILMHISILFPIVIYSILDDIRWWSQGKSIRMSQGKICHKVRFFKRYISTILMYILILCSLVKYLITTKNKVYI